MNTPLRRVGLAMLAMIILLLANATYIQVVKADDYRTDPRNQRVLLEEYARQRGRILTSDEVIIANVKATDDRLRYQRTYANGPMYAPVTGFYSVRYGATGLERAEDEILNGSDDRLFVRRLSDLITGRDPRGGNIVTTINSKAQKAAYQAMKANNFKGAVVAIKPDDGQILAMVSTPSFDPNALAVHDGKAQAKAYDQLPGREQQEQADAEPGDPGELRARLDVQARHRLRRARGRQGQQLPADRGPGHRRGHRRPVRPERRQQPLPVELRRQPLRLGPDGHDGDRARSCPATPRSRSWPPRRAPTR